jgi:hypothetical protein
MSTSNNNELGIDDSGITMGSINSISPIILKIMGLINFGNLVDDTLSSKKFTWPTILPHYAI